MRRNFSCSKSPTFRLPMLLCVTFLKFLERSVRLEIFLHFLTFPIFLVGEVKNGKVNGFHNWLFFLLEELKGDVNYYGFSKGFGFGHGKGGIIKTIFEWEGSLKPVSSIFIGMSPELEFAIYTLAVLLKPNDQCTISLGGKTIDIQTHIFTNRGKKYLGTAFPDI